MHYLLLIYFSNKPLRVWSRPAAHRQEDRLCINTISIIYVRGTVQISI